jgi:hypothetical protein
MASDISLAIGDGARRMTYAERRRITGLMIALARREPARNVDRFYVLAVTRDLFGGWCL